MKRWNKSAQFYLLAAILLVAIIVGFVAVNNYSKNKNPVKVYDLGKELNVEGAKVLDWGTVQEQDLSNIFNNFYKNFSLYAGEGNRQITFILGDKEKICIYTSNTVPTGGESLGGSVIPITKDSLSENCKPGTCKRESIGDNREKITCTLNSIEYEFELTPGENFYFIISQEINGEQHVVRG